MALINCTECGRQISDKAKSCPGCGAPIATTKFCKHCGAKIELDCIVCPRCGKQVEALRDKNIVIWLKIESPSIKTIIPWIKTKVKNKLIEKNGFLIIATRPSLIPINGFFLPLKYKAGIIYIVKNT